MRLRHLHLVIPDLELDTVVVRSTNLRRAMFSALITPDVISPFHVAVRLAEIASGCEAAAANPQLLSCMPIWDIMNKLYYSDASA